MNEKVSRVIFGVETLLTTVPMTMLYLLYATLILPALLDPRFYTAKGVEMLPVAVMLFVGIYLAAAWRVTGAFLVRGQRGIRSLHKIWIRIIDMAAISVLVGIAVACLVHGTTSSAMNALVVFLAGLPMLIPFGHLWIERHWVERQESAAIGIATTSR